MAHSQEEILFHPEIFKTSLCEEYDGSQRSGRGGKRPSCHRYYCPLAHGAQELRSSSLTEEYRAVCLEAAELFPTDTCCKTCAPSWNTTRAFKPNVGASPFYMNGECCAPWSDVGTASLMGSTNFWPMPPDTTDQLPFVGWRKDDAEAETTDANALTYSLQGKSLGGVTEPLKAWSGIQQAPVFIDVGKDGTMTIGPRKLVKPDLQCASQNTQASPQRVYSSI